MNPRIEKVVSHAVLIIASLSVVGPLALVLLAALHKPGDLVTGLSIPTTVDFGSFIEAWNVGNFSSYMLSSLLVAAVVVVTTSVLSILCGYALGTMKFPGSSLLSYIFLFGLMVPLEGIIIPMYYDLRGLGLTDTYWSLILPETALQLSFATFWMRGFFLGVPRELIEAARVDGASSLVILVRILMPIARPAINTMVVLLFMFSWNEFLLPLVMVSGSNGYETAPLGLANFQGRFGADIPGLAAAALIVAVPVFVVYLLFNRQFVQGFLSGAIKG